MTPIDFSVIDSYSFAIGIFCSLLFLIIFGVLDILNSWANGKIREVFRKRKARQIKAMKREFIEEGIIMTNEEYEKWIELRRSVEKKDDDVH